MKKVLNIVKNIFVWLVVIISVFMMVFTIVSVTTFDRNDRSLFGMRIYIVNSDSMKPEFASGDLVFAKETSTPFGDMTIDIQTSRLRHNLTERGGVMEIRYSIAVEHVVTGRNVFRIRVREK